MAALPFILLPRRLRADQPRIVLGQSRRGGRWSAEAWLDAPRRLRVMQALDEAGEAAEPPPTDDLPA